jgi:hypothetical protein
MNDENMSVDTNANVPTLIEQNISTDAADVGFSISLFQNSNFQRALSTIPDQVAKCDTYLALYRMDPKKFIDETDEEEIDDMIRNIKSVLELKKPFDESRQMIKRGINQLRDDLVERYDSILDAAQFKKLSDAENDMKDMKRLLEEHRKDSRWDEIKEVFENYFETARGQALQQMFPRLADFNRFKETHNKMVSGAKTRNITASDKRDVRQILGSYSDGADLISQNPWELIEPYYTRLMQQFENDPTFDTLNARGQSQKTQQIADDIAIRKKREAEENRRKAEEERKRREKEAAEKRKAETKSPTSKIAPVQKPAAPTPAPVRPDVLNYIPEVIRYKFPEIYDYLGKNRRYWQLHTSENQKAALIYETVMMMTDISNPDNPYKDLRSNPSDFLEFIRFVLDC